MEEYEKGCGDGEEGGRMQVRGVKWVREGDGVVVKGWVRWKMRAEEVGR